MLIKGIIIFITFITDKIDRKKILHWWSICSSKNCSARQNDVRKRRNLVRNMHVRSILWEFVLGTNGWRIRKEINSWNSFSNYVRILCIIGKKNSCFLCILMLFEVSFVKTYVCISFLHVFINHRIHQLHNVYHMIIWFSPFILWIEIFLKW